VTVARGPDFLVIGAAKCGTTSLFEYLSAHPRVVPPIRKEIRFFHQMERGLEWYLAHFPPLPGNPAQFITGEASTSYITDYRTPEHVFRHFPRAKLIAILRDPVDRAISHYHDDRRHSDESRSLEEAVDAEIGFLDGATNPAYNAEYWGAGQRGYLSTGLYIHFLERWLKVFPKEQLLVLESKDLQSDPKATMQKVFAFVGVPDNEAGKYDVLLNRGSYAATDDAVRRRLGAFFRPHNQRLEEYLGRKLNWRQ
jgi:hypothetical protein